MKILTSCLFLTFGLLVFGASGATAMPNFHPSAEAIIYFDQIDNAALPDVEMAAMVKEMSLPTISIMTARASSTSLKLKAFPKSQRSWRYLKTEVGWI